MSSSVSVSEIKKYSDKESFTAQRYVYVECSFCSMLDHMMRVSVYSERFDKDPNDAFSCVDFEFPSDWFVASNWIKGLPRTWFKRLLWHVDTLWKRVRLSVIVLFGKRVYFSPSTELSLETAKEFGTKLVQAVEEVEQVLRAGPEC